jgi:hypothetical protein
MAQRKVPPTKRKKKKDEHVSWNFPIQKENFIWIGISLGVILVGYVLLALSITEAPATVDGTWNNFLSVEVAPVVLAIGYCILLPYGILKGKKITRDKYSIAIETTKTTADPTAIKSDQPQ